MKKSQLKKIIKEEIKSTFNKTQAQDDAILAVQDLARNFQAAQRDFLDIMKELQGERKLQNNAHEREFGKMFVDLAKVRDAESKIIDVMYKYINNTEDFKYEDE